MAKKEPLKVITKIIRGDEVIIYDLMSEEEKEEFGKRLNRRAISAVAQAHGCTAEFIDEETATA